MAPNDSAPIMDEGQDTTPVRRKAARYFVPVAVAGVAAATIGLVPALAASGDPDLPKISAQELIEKIAASDTQQLSGMVKIKTDLGLPAISGLAESFASGAGEGGGSGSAAPEERLTQLATGSHTLRVAIDGPERQKLSVLEDDSEYSLIHNAGEVWAYDSASNEVHHSGERSGADRGDGGKDAGKDAGKELSATPKELADEALKAVDGSTSVTVDGTAQVAGRDAYQLAVKPRQSGSTIGSIKIAVDAKTGTPLKFTVNSSDGGKSVIDVGFTKVDFSRPAASTFDFTPPKGAKVTEADEAAKSGKGGDHGPGEQELKDLEKELGALGGLPGGALPGGGMEIIGKDWTAIAKFGGGGAAELPKGSEPSKGSELPKDSELPSEAADFLDALGDPVSGDFGTGTIFKTRLVNALLTDDGTVYAGAVTKDALVKAANADN
ncbi:outer membrane lipoprotein carrier protein LolA [Streptomyces sp. NPDC020141]|uniref:outer membrane lipoprotein carrier protein LolA n=1 Tax=Streptomyces sp. NPDC020141 TaxID=3365065 RepID=UPI0037B75090